MNALSEWSKLIQEQGERSRETEERRNKLFDELRKALAEENPLWYVDLVPRTYLAYELRSDVDPQDKHNELRKAQRDAVENFILPAIRAGIRAGYVTQVKDAPT